MRWATQAEIDDACMTRSANEAHAYLRELGLSGSISQCHTAVSRLIHEGKRQKFATGAPAPFIADPSRAHMIDANRRLLRRMLETEHHYFRKGQEDQMAAALRQAGMVPA